jgi:hypothetical protein
MIRRSRDVTVPRVKPLEEPWRDVIDAVLAKRGTDTSRLAARVAELSKAYNTSGARPTVPLDARIAFSFARDVPKGGAAVRELLPALATPLRIVDLGAGLGAMTWGIVRALEAAGMTGKVDALLIDDDADALFAAESIANEARARLPPSSIDLTIRTKRERLSRGMRIPEADLVVLGQVLSELDAGVDEKTRTEHHADLVRSLIPEQGSLVIVEPALRDRSRHLHAVRDRLLAAGVHVFAPCLHEKPCPALANEGDWCHEDLAVDLPPWLVPLGRSAGLRFEGLTFAYLVLRKDARSVADALAPAAPNRLRLRVVSDRIATKGKTELFACTEHGTRPRLRRLDRDVKEGEPELSRGDLVTLDGAVDERGRIGPNVAIDVRRSGK